MVRICIIGKRLMDRVLSAVMQDVTNLASGLSENSTTDAA